MHMSGFVAVSTGMVTFALLAAIALPHLETGLTFIPIFAVSVLTGYIAAKVYDRRKKLK